MDAVERRLAPTRPPRPHSKLRRCASALGPPNCVVTIVIWILDAPYEVLRPIIAAFGGRGRQQA
jgi:hypothetical protein